MSLGDQARELLARQLSEWPMLRQNVEALSRVRVRELTVDGLTFRLQFNPARIISTAAKTDAGSIAARPCFLCEGNRPVEQKAIAFGEDWRVLANPFPILPDHLTIAHRQHTPQEIRRFVCDMLRLTAELGSRFFVFYNGPKCGASAPDHVHFQAARAGVLPIEREQTHPLRPIVDLRGGFEMVARGFASLHDGWGRGEEPMMNVLSYVEGAGHRLVVIPRVKHRPSFYDGAEDQRILLSPASIDLGGVCVLPREQDFERVTVEHLRKMLREVCPAGVTADGFTPAAG